MLIPSLFNSTLKLIYKSEWDNNAHIIKKSYELDNIERIIASCAARRDGKTAMVSALFAILAIILMGSVDRPTQFIVASKDKNASEKVLEDIMMMMNRLNYDKNSIKIKKTAEEINVYFYDKKGLIGKSRILAFSRTGVSLNIFCVCIQLICFTYVKSIFLY